MKNQRYSISLIYIFLLLISDRNKSTPTINTSINVDDIIDTQKFYDGKEQKNFSSGDSHK
jgi:hypothetical protein